MTDISQINSQLKSIFSNSNFDQVLESAVKVSAASALARQTELKNADQIIDGFKALAQGEVGETIAEFTGDIPGLEEQLIGDVSSAASDLDNITGGTNANGALNVVIGSGAPQAVAAAVENVTGVNPSTVSGPLKNIAPAAIRDAVNDIDEIVSVGASQATGFSSSLSAFSKAFGMNTGGNAGSLLGNIMIGLNVGILNTLDEIADFTGPVNVTKQQILDLLIAGKTDEAIRLLEPISKVPTDELEEKINAINVNPAQATDNSAPQSVGSRSTSCYVIGSNEAAWQGANTPLIRDNTPGSGDYVFTYVNSKEELIAEFRNTTRPITEFVAHWTATYTNQDIGAENVHRWHLDRGWDGCGYHYVIRRDGTLQRGRPVGKKGAHSGAYGHNNYSIGVTFAGGYNCPSGTPSPNRFISADSLNNEQMRTFEMFCAAFYEVYPSGQAYGHADTTDSGKVDPGFDVQQYVLNKFGKTNVNTSGKVSPLSPEQLAARAT